DYQKKVWAQLCTIPYAATWNYAQLAHQLGQPTAARAVGMANGKNPLSIIVPCHRVIGKNQKLTGYAGGLERKAWLLAHESKYRPLVYVHSLFLNLFHVPFFLVRKKEAHHE